MLLEIIIIVLRETLEASILIAILLSVSKSTGVRLTWVPVSLMAGLVGAIGYGNAMGNISEWFDYAGQEVVDVSLQLTIYCLVVALISVQWRHSEKLLSVLRHIMTVIVFIALVREGAELYVFYSGFLQKEGVLVESITSGFVGLAIGLSVGAIVFYALAMAYQSRIKLIHATILTLVAAGMVLQATQLLIQVDWLPSGQPLWDSNGLIAESSIAGQIAYAIFGYEATPSVIEVSFYATSIIVLIAVSMTAIQFGRKSQVISRKL